MIPMMQTPLGQLATVSAGQGAPKDNEFSDSGIPFVRAGSLDGLLSGKSESDLELVSDEIAKIRKLKTYPKGTILFAKSGMSATKDRVYVLQNPAYVVSHLATLIPNGKAHADYLRLALKIFPPSVLIKDPAYPAISLGDIQSYEIPVPEQINDQIRIAHLLSKVEGLIVQRKQHLQQFDDLLKSKFLEMFGDPGKNEKAWNYDYLGNLTSEKIGYGIVQPGNAVDIGVPVIRVGDFIGTRIDQKNIGKVAPEISQKHKNSVLKGDEILLACVGATIGKVAAVEPVHAGYNIVRATARIRASERANRLFLLHFLLSDYAQKYYIKVTRAVGQPTLNIKQIEEMPVITPNIDLQYKFSAIVVKVESLKSRYQHSLTDLQALYGALSQKAFKGELDLSRVPLPRQADKTPDLTKQANMEPTTPAPFQLPDPENADWLAIENRPKLFEFWLTAWCERYADEPFAASRFMDSAYQRLVELTEPDAFQLDKPGKGFDEARWYEEPAPFGINEYEHIKKWIFEVLASGKLMQGFDDADNLIHLKAAQA